MSIDGTPTGKAIDDEATNDETILSPPAGNVTVSTAEGELPIVVADSAASIVTPPKGPKFAELGLRPEVLRALEDMGFEAGANQFVVTRLLKCFQHVVADRTQCTPVFVGFGIVFRRNRLQGGEPC